MTPSSLFEIAVLPGDGIGVEVTAAAVKVLDALSAEIGGIRFNWRHYPGGAQTYRDTGVALADETLQALERADAILFGAMGLPDIRYPDGTEIAPSWTSGWAWTSMPGCGRYGPWRACRAPGAPTPARRGSTSC